MHEQFLLRLNEQRKCCRFPERRDRGRRQATSRHRGLASDQHSFPPWAPHRRSSSRRRCIKRSVSPLPSIPEALRRAILEWRDRMIEKERLRPENAADNETAWWLRLSREHDEAVEFYD